MFSRDAQIPFRDPLVSDHGEQWIRMDGMFRFVTSANTPKQRSRCERWANNARAGNSLNKLTFLQRLPDHRRRALPSTSNSRIVSKRNYVAWQLRWETGESAAPRLFSFQLGDKSRRFLAPNHGPEFVYRPQRETCPIRQDKSYLV